MGSRCFATKHLKNEWYLNIYHDIKWPLTCRRAYWTILNHTNTASKVFNGSSEPSFFVPGGILRFSSRRCCASPAATALLKTWLVRRKMLVEKGTVASWKTTRHLKQSRLFEDNLTVSSWQTIQMELNIDSSKHLDPFSYLQLNMCLFHICLTFDLESWGFSDLLRDTPRGAPTTVAPPNARLRFPNSWTASGSTWCSRRRSRRDSLELWLDGLSVESNNKSRVNKIRPHRFGGEGVLIGVQTATLNA